MSAHQEVITQAYQAFNTRDIDGVLRLMVPEVTWPNGWEGGYVSGHAAVREYWQRQWQEINPTVTPLSTTDNGSGQTEVVVHQLIEDKQGNLVSDGLTKHVYTFDGDKIKRMDIAPAA